MSLKETLTTYWLHVQHELLPWLDDAVGPLGERHKQLVSVLGLARIEAFVPSFHGLVGRPLSERAALARAFVAKAVFNFPTTILLIETLSADKTLRRLCGWQRAGEVPSEATFSRAFAAFAESALPSRLHEALIQATQADRLVGHISRDSTAIEAREKPAARPEQVLPSKRRRGRPRKGEVRLPAPVRRIVRQAGMSLPAMLADLPRHCDVGTKRNAKGHQESWIGYKLHIDTADGEIPISCLLTAASVHDSQAAIPLATMTATRVVNLYDLMDSAYDVAEIKQHSRDLGHVPIIDINPRATPGLKQELAQEEKRLRRIGHHTAEQARYRERSTAERVNGGLKDNHGGRTLRVRGPDKVMCHLMFGVLSFTALQLIRLVI
ncbi:transposase, IS4 family protein [mine drainage metagenome]|uniref:Transposase, IS4 family protein n=1 Tax=mine drainage metagenome TaxID=410659 RepID=T0Y8P5_9ZZZZ